mmetsp:Transcript_23068/g.47016  ORF Transcript_23068/g.47016 Transcript_23068/m.47016 type:complete len:230 (-) Transcript_23068:543-1232(-)
MIAISTGVGFIGLASGFEELCTCRLISGLGVAGLSCATTMTVADISTPLNRASSFAPISAGFAAGTAMGPALGGVLIDQLGVSPTFYLVGGCFLMLGGVNSILLDETLRRPNRGFPWQQQQQQQQQQQHNMPSFQNSAPGAKSMKFTDALNPFQPFLAQPGDEPAEEDPAPLAQQFDARLRLDASASASSSLARSSGQQHQQQQQQREAAAAAADRSASYGLSWPSCAP